MTRLCSYRLVRILLRWVLDGAGHRCTLAVVLALLLTSGCARNDGTDVANGTWSDVQVQFDRLETLEVDFRVAAAAAVGKPDPEKLQLVRDALRAKFQMQADLRRTMQHTTKALASQPMSVRASYASYLRGQQQKFKAVESATAPAVDSLGLKKYDKELGAYSAELAAEAGLR